eukprot:4050129-Pyramimonas_sp.AAC.1
MFPLSRRGQYTLRGIALVILRWQSAPLACSAPPRGGSRAPAVPMHSSTNPGLACGKSCAASQSRCARWQMLGRPNPQCTPVPRAGLGLVQGS